MMPSFKDCSFPVCMLEGPNYVEQNGSFCFQTPSLECYATEQACPALAAILS